MDTQRQAIEQLCRAMEAKAGRAMRTPKDFIYLSEMVFEQQHQTISPTTLKRMWDYLSEPVSPRSSTLNILAQFVGFEDWEAFCQRQEQQTADAEEDTTPPRKRKWMLLEAALVAAAALIAWGMFVKPAATPSSYILKAGQTFRTYNDYLALFGIQDTTTYWGKILPHHPNILIWGPEYNHPDWHNYGNKDSMMPTITERWEPIGADSAIVVMRNRDKYNHEVRLNEVRITFMKNLTGIAYVFLGIYRLSLPQSDTTHCVWERIATECDLGHLGYLEELRN